MTHQIPRDETQANSLCTLIMVRLSLLSNMITSFSVQKQSTLVLPSCAETIGTTASSTNINTNNHAPSCHQTLLNIRSVVTDFTDIYLHLMITTKGNDSY